MIELGTALLKFWSSMLNHLWQSSLVILPLFLLARGLRQAPARLGDRFWALALLKLCLPLAVGGVLAKYLLDAVSGWLVSDAAVATGTLAGVVTTVLDPEPGWGYRWISSRPWMTVGLVCMTVLWQLAVIWGVATAIRDLNLVNRLQHDPVADLPAFLRERLLWALAKADIPASAVVITAAATMPAVFGMLRPRILASQRLVAALPAEDLVAVLKHEDAHRRRRDPLRFLLLRLCQAVFFFYPLIHPISRRLREGAEYACDEKALATGIGPRGYARALARAVNLNLATVPTTVAAGTGGPTLLKKRLSRLHQPERSDMSRYRLILVAAVVLVCAGSFLPLGSTADTPPPPPPPAEASDTDALPPPPAPSAPTMNREDVADDPPPPPPKKEEEAKAKNGKKDKAASKSEEKVAKEKSAEGESLVTPPRIIHLAKPEYPASAREAKAEGKVVLKVLVDEKGKVVKVKVKQGVEGYPELTEAAVKAAELCTFDPGTKDGEPATVWAMIPFEFKLE